MKSFFVKCLFLFMVVIILAVEEECPSKCICKRNTQRDGANYLKMKCGEIEKILHLDELELLNLASEIVQLNLSDNNLKSFTPKVELIALQKLDLSRNQLTELKETQFHEVPNLRRLDLTKNIIKHIDLQAFNGLKHLERLKLTQNEITSITVGTFDPLINLKQLDISYNPLQCDCGLLWLLNWSQKVFVKLVSNPKCSSPPAFKGQPLRKLKIGVDIHCKSPAGNNGLPIVDLKPQENQVVFEGDTLRLQCRAPSISDTYDERTSSRIEWTWLDSDPQLYFNDVHIENDFLPSTGLIGSTLSITRLRKNHTGVWNCVFLSMHGNHSKGITIIVISDDTKYCPIDVTSNNKGTYNWPRTIVNHTVAIPCESVNLNYDVTQQIASYYCSIEGEWKDLNTSMCSYISDTTKILEQFSKVNSSILESARHFKNYTSNLNIFKDVMDLVYAITTIENYLKYSGLEHFSNILLDVVGNLLDLPAFYLRGADKKYECCRRLINVTENLALLSTSTLLQKGNIVLEAFPVKKESFSGMKCTWYVNPNNRLDSLFSCVTNNQNEAATLQGKVIEASITIPYTLFYQLQKEQDDGLLNKAYYNILISMHSTSKLFPIDDRRKGKEDVTSAVVGVKLIDVPVRNLSDPVYIMLRTPLATMYEVTPFIPVWWDPSLNNGTGAWSSKGCHFSHELQDHLVFSCRHFGYYGVMQDITHLQLTQAGAKFKLSHPAIYVGSLILFTSFLVVILTYLFCYATIQMPKNAKHSLINTWISITLLCFMYSFGIYQTEDVKVCQIVGMVLHYLTLCSLLWMCVGVNCMYKRLNKNDVIGLQDDDLPSDQPVQKPILGLYLVGWGIALIICGLSAAINMREYSSQTHCFLRTGPALSALYIPFAILTLFLCVFFLLIRCAVYNLDTNGHLSEGTQATEHVDLDLLEPSFPNQETRSIRSISSKTPSSEVEDPEHAPSAQLKAYVIFLLVYVMTWLSCAFATVPPFHMISYEEDLFSIAYAILSTTLSAFTMFFYCVARNDIRTQWMVMCMRMRRKKCFRSRNVSDASPNIPQIQIQPLPLPPISNALAGPESQVLSRSSSRSSSRTKSNSHTSNILKGAVDLNGSFSDHQGAKINNVNLVVLHRAQYRSNIIPNIIENPTNAAEVFYNPHQSTVARKFFKRQKRNMMKKNNLVKPPRDLNSDTASVFSEPRLLKSKTNMDQNIFGTNSKVNNTNIHVEQIKKIQKKNPNIFSDSGDEFDSVSNMPVDNIVINAERLRKKELSRHKPKKKHNLPSQPQSEITENNMRSVSQQCTLEYSSENISDSILDKSSPDKALLPNQDNFLLEVSESVRCENSPIEGSLLTEEDPSYAKIDDLHRSSTIRNDYFLQPKFNTCHKKNRGKLYTNPCHDFHISKRTQSRASSVSVSDLDELYQQIRRGPQIMRKSQHVYSTIAHASPCLSDSEINSYVSDLRNRRRMAHSHDNFDCLSDDVETTV